MPPKSIPEADQEIQFVVATSSNPNNGTSAINRRRIRSQAATKSWPGRRRRNFEQLDELNRSVKRPAPPRKTGDAKVQKRAAKAGSSTKAGTEQLTESTTYAQSSEELSRPRLSRSSTLSAGSLTSVTTVDETFGPVTPHTRPSTPCKCPQCWPDQSLSVQEQIRDIVKHGHKRKAEDEIQWEGITLPVSPLRLPAAPYSGMADPYNCAPVPSKPWFDNVLHHMMTVFAPRGWPALRITNEQGLMWERFMTQHALAEPALFYVRLLFASGDMIRLGILPRETSYWLQAQAINAINEALQNPNRASSDGLILAVGRIGFHESMYGDRNAANTVHRPAQQRMIQMRGGMKALEFPELVKRLMRLTDSIMARQGGTARYIEDDEQSTNFTMTEGVRVLENWVPNQGQALRRSIKIADIVND
ncbi:hypothetical protein LTR86_000635 [Recurvomyces mirabilis]|nr:hypothetical protein LTR86_000635 [Recurvomyces mirabilis]